MAFPMGHRRKQKGVLTDKTRTRIEIAIRLEMQNLGLTDSEIANQIGIKPMSFARLKKTPVYQQLRTQFRTGILANVDAGIYSDYNKNRDRLDRAVPMALEKLIQLATKPTADDKTQLAAATEILDRHGRFAKVSRTGAPTAEQGGAAKEEDNKVANELISALNQAKSTQQTGT